jgi:diguanylate cyclase (GGDEF)-like protein
MAIVLLFLIRRQVGRPLSAITRALSTVASGNFNVQVPGHDRRDEIGVLARALEVFLRTAQQLDQAHRDAEEARRQVETLARHDVLTGLPNRRLLSEEMRRALARIGRSGGICAILVADLDRFKPVNDVYGHATGDAVLCELAKRLSRILRKSETLARLGGDEFAVVAEFVSDPDGPMRLAARLIEAASLPITVDGTVIEVGATIGVALAANDGSDPDSLLRAADIAMYRGKREGRGCIRFFEESMELELRGRLHLETELRAGIAAGEIMPHYQPVVSLVDQQLLGFEILARWHHPKKGLLPPAVFISVAQETGMIPELTYSILRTACRDAKHWPAHLTLALNVSPSQLKDTQLAVRLLSILVEEGFPPERLEVEVTEDALVADLDGARAILESLQNIGIRVALDDFGTGYSSLYHLRELHFDKIKIDRSFVQSIFENRGNNEIVKAIIGMSKSLGLPTTAEGIEDFEQMRKLAELGCENGQGFYFGAAVSAAEAGQVIITHGRNANVAWNAPKARAAAS